MFYIQNLLFKCFLLTHKAPSRFWSKFFYQKTDTQDSDYKIFYYKIYQIIRIYLLDCLCLLKKNSASLCSFSTDSDNHLSLGVVSYVLSTKLTFQILPLNPPGSKQILEQVLLSEDRHTGRRLQNILLQDIYSDQNIFTRNNTEISSSPPLPKIELSI